MYRMAPNLKGPDWISSIGKARSCIKMVSPPRHVYLHYPAEHMIWLGQHSTDSFEQFDMEEHFVFLQQY